MLLFECGEFVSLFSSIQCDFFFFFGKHVIELQFSCVLNHKIIGAT